MPPLLGVCQLWRTHDDTDSRKRSGGEKRQLLAVITAKLFFYPICVRVHLTGDVARKDIYSNRLLDIRSQDGLALKVPH